MYTEALLNHIKAYSYIFRTLLSLAYLHALPYLEPEIYSKSCVSLLRHIENPAIVRTVYSGITQPYSKPCKTLHMQQPGMLAILEYSELFYNCIQMHIENPVIFAKIDKPSLALGIQNPGKLAILEH